MGASIELRRDYGPQDLRDLARRSKVANQSRRLLALAAVLDEHRRAAAAKIGGMDRQTLRDWVHRFNAEGPEGLLDRKAPGQVPKLSPEQKARLAAVVEEGPIGFENNCVPRCKRRADFDRHEKELRIPWHNRGHDSQWFPFGENKKIGLVDWQDISADLVSASSKKLKEFRNVFRLPARFLQYLARVNRFRPAQFFGFFGQQVCQTAQTFATLGRRHLGPWPHRECTVGRAYGPVNVFGRRFGNARPDLTVGWVDTVERLAVRCADPVTIDEHLIGMDIRHLSVPSLADPRAVSILILVCCSLKIYEFSTVCVEND